MAWLEQNQQPEARNNAIPAAPYAARPPSPPSIMIPARSPAKANQPLNIVPRFANIDPKSLSAPELEIITQSRPQSAYDCVSDWSYRDRWLAHEILDFMWLGPSRVVRDEQFLQQNQFTMLLAARDARLAQARLMTVDRVATALGLQAESVDVEDHQDLIRKLPDVIAMINKHMLDVYHSQAVVQDKDNNEPMGNNEMKIDPSKFRRGKILIFCETGNDRSAVIVIAYLMAVFGLDMIKACQFVNYRRFCVCLDEPAKQMLRTFEGILVANRTVNKHVLQSGAGNSLTVERVSKRSIKRSLEEDDDGDDAMTGVLDENDLDRDRFTDRKPFAPFIDR